ncbi:MAG: type II secretion system protein [Phycisphaerae bacterium]
MAKRAAFTLVELLVVISIIALLMGILVPVVSSARTAARRGACAAHLHAVGVGFQMYLNGSKDIMPVAAQMPSLNLNEDPPIAEVLRPHLSSPEALLCPADPDRKYFQREGSSYEYHSMLGGQKVSESFLTRRWGEDRTPVMHDYETFHGPPGTPGAANYLFADGHVGDLE